jgi:hypothetical protein
VLLVQSEKGSIDFQNCISQQKAKVVFNVAKVRSEWEKIGVTMPLRRLKYLSEEHIIQLAGVLMDCVTAFASVSFMKSFTQERAVTFWQHVSEELTAGRHALPVIS